MSRLTFSFLIPLSPAQLRQRSLHSSVFAGDDYAWLAESWLFGHDTIHVKAIIHQHSYQKMTSLIMQSSVVKSQPADIYAIEIHIC